MVVLATVTITDRTLRCILSRCKVYVTGIGMFSIETFRSYAGMQFEETNRWIKILLLYARIVMSTVDPDKRLLVSYRGLTL